MTRKNILSIVIAAAMLAGSTFGHVGHGTHVAGTIGATGNTTAPQVGGAGRDVLVGGRGSDWIEYQAIGILVVVIQAAGALPSAPAYSIIIDRRP